MWLQKQPCSSMLPGLQQVRGIGITPRLTGEQTVATSMLRTGPARLLGLREIITVALQMGGDLCVKNGQMGGWIVYEMYQFSLVPPQIIYTTHIL